MMSLIFACTLLLFAHTGIARAQIFLGPGGVDSATCGQSQQSPCATLQNAINISPVDGQILVLPGVYKGVGNYGVLFKGKSVKINGTTTPQDVVFDAEGNDRIMWFDMNDGPGIVISSITILNGAALSGGCLMFTANSQPRFYNVAVKGCKAVSNGKPESSIKLAGSGGAIVTAVTASPLFVRCNISDSTAEIGGGGIWTNDNSTPQFLECNFFRLSSAIFGGGIVPEGNSEPVFDRCKVYDSESVYGGGMDTGSETTAKFINTDFYNNKAQFGGAAYHFANDNTSFTNCRFYDNWSKSNGAAIAVTSKTTPTYNNCIFENNVANGAAAIYAEAGGVVTITNSIVRNNTCVSGAAGVTLRTTSKAVFYNTLFQGNIGGGTGVGAVSDNTLLEFDSCRMIDNIGIQDSGALATVKSGVIRIKNTIVRNNTGQVGGVVSIRDTGVFIAESSDMSQNNGNMGGAIFSASTVNSTITGSTISENKATKGGAIFIAPSYEYTSSFIILKDTVAERNSAKELGGAAFVQAGSTAAVYLSTNTTFKRNTAHFGGGLYLEEKGSLIHSTSLITANVGGTIKTLATGSTRQTGGGGGVYSAAAFSYLKCADMLSCNNTIQNNVAGFGNDEATDPVKLESLQNLRSTYSPKDTFNVSVALVDGLGNKCTDLVDIWLVEVLGLNGMQVNGLILKKVFDNGEVMFGPLSVVGFLNGTYSLSVSTKSIVKPLTYKITIGSCGPGYQNSINPYTTPYVCSQCPAGSFSRVENTQCLQCPAGASCFGSNVIADVDYWIDPAQPFEDTPLLYKCRKGVCIGDSKCAKNRYGVVCATCDEGYSDFSGQCVRCDREEPQWLIVSVVVACVVVGLLIRYPAMTQAGTMSALIFFVQVASVLLPSNYSFTVIIQTVSLVFDWFTVLAGGETVCVLKVTPLQKMLFGFFFPLVAIACSFAWLVLITFYYNVLELALPESVRKLLHRKKTPPATKSADNKKNDPEIQGSAVDAGGEHLSERKEHPTTQIVETDHTKKRFLKVPHTLWIDWMNQFVFVLLWAYFLISKVALRLISCTTIANYTVVSEAPAQLCRQMGHFEWWAFGWFLVIVWVAGFPLGLLVVVGWALKRGARKHHTTFWADALAVVHKEFKPEQWFYEFVFLMRKLAVLLIDANTVYEPVTKCLSLLLWAFLALVTVRIDGGPWKHTRDNSVEEFILVCLMLLSALALALSTHENPDISTNFTSIQLSILVIGIALPLLSEPKAVRAAFWKLLPVKSSHQGHH